MSPQPPSPYGPDPVARETDVVSIVGLVLTVLLCTAPIGLGFGIAGLVRTSQHRRRGRWAALTATILGSVLSLAMIGGFGALIWLGLRVVPTGQVTVGQCLDVDEGLEQSSTLWKKSCDESHDAEVVATGVFDAEAAAGYDPDDVETFCRPRVADGYRDVVDSGPYELRTIVGDFVAVERAKPGQAFVCYAVRADGAALTAPLPR